MNVGEIIARLRLLSGLASPLNTEGREAVAFVLRLIERGIANAKYRESSVPLWANVSSVFGHGSSYSIELCEAFGADPHAKWEPEEEGET